MLYTIYLVLVDKQFPHHSKIASKVHPQSELMISEAHSTTFLAGNEGGLDKSSVNIDDGTFCYPCVSNIDGVDSAIAMSETDKVDEDYSTTEGLAGNIVFCQSNNNETGTKVECVDSADSGGVTDDKVPDKYITLDHIKDPYLSLWPIPLHASKQDIKTKSAFKFLNKTCFDTTGQVFVLAVHLCGILSIRAVKMFNAFPQCSFLALKPCCLPDMSHAKRKETFLIGKHKFLASEVCSPGKFVSKSKSARSGNKWLGPPRHHLAAKFNLWADNLLHGIELDPYHQEELSGCTASLATSLPSTAASEDEVNNCDAANKKTTSGTSGRKRGGRRQAKGTLTVSDVVDEPLELPDYLTLTPDLAESSAALLPSSSSTAEAFSTTLSHKEKEFIKIQMNGGYQNMYLWGYR